MTRPGARAQQDESGRSRSRRPGALPTAASFLALGAIALWSSLAVLSVRLAGLPPLFVIGAALAMGSLATLPQARTWRVPAGTLALGLYGLFGYHFLLFLALRRAPAIEANLLNYLWPLLLVLLSSVLLPGVRLGGAHVGGALLGFAGSAVVVLGRPTAPSIEHLAGYCLAVLAAFVWASYSLLTRRVAPFPTAAVGGFGAASGVVALALHGALEPECHLTPTQWCLLMVLGLGPMGVAFLLWDAALKRGDPRAIGTLAYLTPLLSTGLLALDGRRGVGLRDGAALLLIVAGAWVGKRATPASD
jgi:drug/metabolite transporter (DMT)-like permease